MRRKRKAHFIKSKLAEHLEKNEPVSELRGMYNKYLQYFPAETFMQSAAGFVQGMVEKPNVEEARGDSEKLTQLIANMKNIEPQRLQDEVDRTIDVLQEFFLAVELKPMVDMYKKYISDENPYDLSIVKIVNKGGEDKLKFKNLTDNIHPVLHLQMEKNPSAALTRLLEELQKLEDFFTVSGHIHEMEDMYKKYISDENPYDLSKVKIANKGGEDKRKLENWKDNIHSVLSLQNEKNPSDALTQLIKRLQKKSKALKDFFTVSERIQELDREIHNELLAYINKGGGNIQGMQELVAEKLGIPEDIVHADRNFGQSSNTVPRVNRTIHDILTQYYQEYDYSKYIGKLEVIKKYVIAHVKPAKANVAPAEPLVKPAEANVAPAVPLVKSAEVKESKPRQSRLSGLRSKWKSGLKILQNHAGRIKKSTSPSRVNDKKSPSSGLHQD